MPNKICVIDGIEYALVPVEPTPEMLGAVSWPGCARTDYAHMLAAAPSAPAAPSVDAERVLALVEEYGDVMFAAGISCGHHEHRNEREYRDDADEAKAQIRALLSAPLAASGWQPIETAPKDGTAVVVTGWDCNKPGGTRHYAVARFERGEWWADGTDSHDVYEYLTHWHPLPPPPAIANQEEE